MILAVMVIYVLVFVFFFKQKTAYEIRLSLVGSEMCIRDRYKKTHPQDLRTADHVRTRNPRFIGWAPTQFLGRQSRATIVAVACATGRTTISSMSTWRGRVTDHAMQ